MKNEKQRMDVIYRSFMDILKSLAWVMVFSLAFVFVFTAGKYLVTEHILKVQSFPVECIIVITVITASMLLFADIVHGILDNLYKVYRNIIRLKDAVKNNLIEIDGDD